MNPQPASSTTSSTLLHCQHRFASRRFCRLPVSDQESSLCSKHAAERQRGLDQADLAAALIGNIEEFRSAADINHSLGELYKLQARNKITPRRAAVMAYTANLLLRTLPAIERQEKPEEDDHLIMDIPSAARNRTLAAMGYMPIPERQVAPDLTVSSDTQPSGNQPGSNGRSIDRRIDRRIDRQ